MVGEIEHRVTARFESESESEWQVAGFRLTERLNEPYEIAVELFTTDLWAEPTRLLGTKATLFIERATLLREVPGIIERIEDGEIQAGHLVIRVILTAGLRALGMRKNSRIFQEVTIPEILQKVLNEGLGPFERRIDIGGLSGNYVAQEYTVQFGETDLQFADRLMEEYGISYRFSSEDGEEVMVLGDSAGAWVDLISLGNHEAMLPVNLREGGSGGREEVRSFRRTSELRSTVVRTMVFDWLTPTPLINAQCRASADLAINGAKIGPEREEYDHSEPSTTHGYRSIPLDVRELEAGTARRRALHQRDAVRCVGTSTAILMTTGCKFELIDHPHADLGGEYLVTEVIHSFGTHAGSQPGTDAYINQFECIPSTVEWRPTARHPRPRVAGIQTATVVGPAGEEIHTDAHGRIKVQFHWDRGGEFDENSSCFVRVVQPWAGNGWGFVWLPRIGMEVAVSFVDGDLDRPIVAGCLYNGAHSTPYPLPNEKTKSTIKSESSPGGGGFNELRFEDAAGSEEIFLHAQKDLREVVLHDMATSVGCNQSLRVGNNRCKEVGGHEVIAVHKDRIAVIDGSESVHVKGSLDMTIDGGTNKGRASDPSPLGARVSVTGEYNMVASSKLTITVGDSIVVMDPNHISIEAKDRMDLKVGESLIVLDPSNISLAATDSMTMKVGESFITLLPDRAVIESVTVEAVGNTSALQLDEQADLMGGTHVLIHKGASSIRLDGNAVMAGEIAKVEGGAVAVIGNRVVEITGNPIKLNS